MDHEKNKHLAKYTGKLAGKIYPVYEIVNPEYNRGLTSVKGCNQKFLCTFDEILDIPYGNGLREVEVTYSDGKVVGTNMSPLISDAEIYRYFAPGKEFNVGNLEDDIQIVLQCKIIK